MPYNKKLSADAQISMEEQIAAVIFDQTEISEEDAADLGRRVLRMVLAEFRPDLISKAKGRRWM